MLPVWVLVAIVSSFQERASKQRAPCSLNFAVSKATKNTSPSGLVPLFSLDPRSSKCCPHTGHSLGCPCKHYGWFWILLLTAPCFETTYKINKLKTFSTDRGPHCVCDGIRRNIDSMSTFQFLPRPSQARVKTRSQFQEQRSGERGCVQKGKRQKL